VVVAADGRPVGSSLDLVRELRASPGEELVLTVRRDGARVDLPVTPAPLPRFARNADGSIDTTRLETVGNVGLSPRSRVDVERLGFVDSVEESGAIAVNMLDGIRRTVTEKLGTITKIYSDDRDPEGFVGIVGVGRISGEVLASRETGAVKALSFILIVASLNLFVGLFNLLPLLPLDGGHIAVAVFEGARDRLRRLRGYRGPFQRVDYVKLLPVTYAVAGVFLLFTVALVGADLVNPIRLS
jgi:membrane-associated protease RseP (regulator of RpoE activity)